MRIRVCSAFENKGGLGCDGSGLERIVFLVEGMVNEKPCISAVF